MLKEAQDLGFAEADPTADVDGLDVRAKIALLTKLAIGVYVDPQKVNYNSVFLFLFLVLCFFFSPLSRSQDQDFSCSFSDSLSRCLVSLSRRPLHTHNHILITTLHYTRCYDEINRIQDLFSC